MIAGEAFYFYIFSGKKETFVGVASFDLSKKITEMALECRRIWRKDNLFQLK